MKNQAIAISGLVLVVLGIVATVCLFAFEDGIRRLDWVNIEAAALGTGVICLVGGILGWLSVKTSTGKVAAILGSLLVLFFALQLMNTQSPSHPASPAEAQQPAP